ncbi:hypothetical protein [Streptomyces sp. NBC_00448]
MFATIPAISTDEAMVAVDLPVLVVVGRHDVICGVRRPPDSPDVRHRGVP